ncbi:MAG: imidazole glycerol phosphate synthase subunit HisH [Woeseiaceae bacterium]|jgi:glutamine amidotransferase|nr:imidazole glycerol phosphate synthase subunit HisH [Woeseiaceae bacterium]|tara:strand:+ start:2059 stop:2664 length:606 start_codon:yes stop_codon:yes gene_type:complete
MAASQVAIVNCGGANIASLTNALERLNANYSVTMDASRIRNSSHVIIPGVGHAADAMQKLQAQQLNGTIANLEQPVLGICLGLQLLAQSSAEENVQCLGVIDAQVSKLTSDREFPIPNIGWCKVSALREHRLLAGIDDGSYFYFVHSYVIPCGPYTLATANHALKFTAILEQDNFFATQFHPERSAEVGAKLLSNFLGANQ